MGPETVLMILGCQRSGTTMMTEIFSRDADAKVFGEYSVLSGQDRRDRLRLAPLDVVAGRLRRSRYPLIVMKPLVESQRADELLSALPHARALWLYRDVADVARSNLNLFGQENGIRNLERLLSARAGDWRGERVPGEIRKVIQSHFSTSMDPLDAAALFWWARNSLYFALGLDERSDVLPVRYESVVLRPWETMASIYEFAGRRFPGEGLIDHVSTESVGRESTSRLSSPVQSLCLSMLERLDDSVVRRQKCA
jgi:hypothetical protein